jgi:hypothetical protein
MENGKDAQELTRLLKEQILDKNYQFIIEEARWHDFDILAFTQKGYSAGYEIKSDRDNVSRFLEQLPKYAVFLDAVFLVLGEQKAIPKWLPSWVGVYQLKEGKFQLLQKSEIHRFPIEHHWFNISVIESATDGKSIDPYSLWRQLKIWFANSCLAYKYGPNAIPYDVIYGVLKRDKLPSGHPLEHKKAVNRTLIKDNE